MEEVFLGLIQRIKKYAQKTKEMTEDPHTLTMSPGAFNSRTAKTLPEKTLTNLQRLPNTNPGPWTLHDTKLWVCLYGENESMHIEYQL